MRLVSVSLLGYSSMTGSSSKAFSGIHSLGTGEAFGILAALFYTAYIIITARMVPEKEAFQIGILQNGFLGLYGLGAAFVTGTARLPHSRLELVCILMLAIVCSAFGLTLQPEISDSVVLIIDYSKSAPSFFFENGSIFQFFKINPKPLCDIRSYSNKSSFSPAGHLQIANSMGLKITFFRSDPFRLENHGPDFIF